jgi:two-component SAPR family response regulator
MINMLLKQFGFSALDYLLKPIDREELQKAVQKVGPATRSPTSRSK